MSLTEMTIKDFTEKLSSNAPAPGGGSAAALSGALGAALVSMVCNLTAGKAKYAEQEPLVRKTLASADDLRVKLLEAIQKDTDAFDTVMAALGMPKGTDEEKARRSDAIQAAYREAIASPQATAEYCLAVMKLAESLVGKSNVNAVSDLSVGAAQAYAGLKGALVNVKINLPFLKEKDIGKNSETKGTAAEKRAWMERVEQEAAELLQTVETGVARLLS
ncbi:MAG: cyclodeaminase/cyclohydrolase family protein [Synergistaceae bacterium]|jgi:formiminotetrahydrofolate cyclodeaminase|nr:cyclodeaminase/cyclohydrolase family protein [Synergistaceae bacterium]